MTELQGSITFRPIEGGAGLVVKVQSADLPSGLATSNARLRILLSAGINATIKDFSKNKTGFRLLESWIFKILLRTSTTIKAAIVSFN